MNLEKRLRQLETLSKVSALINSTLDSTEIRERTIEALSTLLGAEVGSLMLTDRHTGELYFEVATGERGESLKTIRLKPGEGIAGCVLADRRPLIINDAQADPRLYRKADERSGFVTRNLICVPVLSKDVILGVLEALNKRGGDFDDDDLELMTSLANQVAVAVENARLYEELKETFYATAEALAETIDLRDPYTGGHTRRVMTYSLVVGRFMGLGRTEMENLRLAAILHDIGKIGVRDDVLLKQGKLDDEEFKKMSRHPEYGSEVLERIRQLHGVIPGVRGHHERFDGRGYPDRLQDGAIPLPARIIAVADTYDAMTTDRPYRKGLAAAEALAELSRCSGTQFDPVAVAAFREAWNAGEIAP
jgi:HD-GYP domain-containing protein (c-di-GMP phosphodiesterase class II)